ncbi:hypothetical protein [Halomonas sp. E19]
MTQLSSAIQSWLDKSHAHFIGGSGCLPPADTPWTSTTPPPRK